MALSHLDRSNIAANGTFKSRVRVAVAIEAYDTLNVAPSDPSDAAEVRRRQVLRTMITRPENAERVAHLIASKMPDAWVTEGAINFQTEPSDAQLNIGIDAALDVFGDVAAS